MQRLHYSAVPGASMVKIGPAADPQPGDRLPRFVWGSQDGGGAGHVDWEASSSQNSVDSMDGAPSSRRVSLREDISSPMVNRWISWWPGLNVVRRRERGSLSFPSNRLWLAYNCVKPR